MLATTLEPPRLGGQAVNAYVESLVSLDLDLAVAADQLPPTQGWFPAAHKYGIMAR